MAPLPRSLATCCLCLLVLLLIFPGCGQFKSMAKLQKDVSSEFGITVTRVSINNGVHLQLIFENADLEGKDPAALSREIAEFTRDNYEDYGKLKTVSIVFGTHSQYGPVSVSSTSGTYTFSVSDLAKDEEKADSD